MKDLPMFAIGNDELDNLKHEVKDKDYVYHRLDSGEWERVQLSGVNYKGSEDTEWTYSAELLCYKTSEGKAYIAAINGKLLERDNLKL